MTANATFNIHISEKHDLLVNSLVAIGRLAVRSTASRIGSCGEELIISARTVRPLTAHLYRLESDSEHQSGVQYLNDQPLQFLVAFQVGDNYSNAVFEALIRVNVSSTGAQNSSMIAGIPLSHLSLAVEDSRPHVFRRREGFLLSQPDRLALFCSSFFIRIRVFAYII